MDRGRIEIWGLRLMAERQERIELFLEMEGWGKARRKPLTSDASFRRYTRLEDKNRRAILMDAPAPEETGPFLSVAHHLTKLGYSAPKILAADHKYGFILLEDFGNSTFTRLLEAGEQERELYLLATDVLIDLHKHPAAEAIPQKQPSYSLDLLLAEAALLTVWFVPAAIGRLLSADAIQEYQHHWRSLISLPVNIPESLVLRDYHVDNLMRLDDRTGIAACGLLDFQDAVAGPVTYDLVSLIEDARRDVSPAIAKDVKQRYLAAFPNLDPNQFDLSMAVLGAQRHAKVIGIFTRLCVRDNKRSYLSHIPRVWRLLEAACEHPDLKIMQRWINLNIPTESRLLPEGFGT